MSFFRRNDMIFVGKKSSLLLGHLAAKSKNSTLFSSYHLQTPHFLFSSSANHQSSNSLFIIKYLIDSVGLSSEEATKASKLIAHIKSPSKPDSVREYFRKNGFSDTDIKTIICRSSRLLCSHVDSTLKPKLEGLRDLGFSETQISKLITAYPASLRYLNRRNLLPRIEFITGILGSNVDLVKAFCRCSCLLSSDIEKQIKPAISFLKECQLSNERIRALIIGRHNVLGRPLSSLKAIVKKVNQLGIPCGSGMFFRTFFTFCGFNSATVEAKYKILVSFGFSGEEVLSAVLKQPSILHLSHKNLSETIDFLVNKVGLELIYVINNPTILTLSLTKRLIPRNYVLQLIKRNGHLNEVNFYTAVLLSEKRFIEKFISPFEEKIPELHDVYLYSSGSKLLN